MELSKKSITPKNYIVFTIFMIIITIIINVSILTMSSSIKNSKTDFKEISYLYEVELLKEDKIIQNSLNKMIFHSQDLINNDIIEGSLGLGSLTQKFINLFEDVSCYDNNLKMYKINNDTCKITFQKEILKFSFENNFKKYFDEVNRLNSLDNFVIKYKVVKTNNEFKIIRFSKIDNFYFEENIFLELDFSYLTNLLFETFEVLGSQKIESENLIQNLNEKIENENFIFKNNEGDIIELYFKEYLIFSFLNSY